MGLDVGMRRIGVALSDAMGWTAQPLETVEVKPDGSHLRRIRAICEGQQVESIVAGVPLELSGRAGVMARRVRAMIKALEEVTGLEIVEMDERLTTRQAERALDEAGVGERGRRKAVVDQIAASLILQCHLDARGRR